VEDSLTPYARTGQDRKARLLAIGGEGAIALYINSWGRLRDNGTTRAKCLHGFVCDPDGAITEFDPPNASKTVTTSLTASCGFQGREGLFREITHNDFSCSR
jgi:hypothetical protein